MFLARCSLALGNKEEAIEFMELGELREFALARERFPRLELFLDVEPNLAGKRDYTWKEDQALGTKTDILIGAGHISEAFETYKQIKLHRSPRAFLCFHSWYDPLWQDYLRGQISITDEIDVKLGYTFDDYDDELETSGDKRVQALNVFAQGERDKARGDFLLAGFRFERARRIAEECDALDIRFKSATEGCICAVQIRKKELAMRRLNVVEGLMHQVNNPVLLQQFQIAEQSLVSL